LRARANGQLCKPFAAFRGRLIESWLLFMAALLVASCSSNAPQSPSYSDVPSSLPETYSASPDSSSHRPLAWWESFADPALNRVVEAALAANLDLRQAVARVEQARARARIARAAFFPSVAPALSAVDLETPTNAGIGAQLDELGFGPELIEDFGFALPDRLQLRTFSFSAEFAYEADFWGRHRQDALAAGALQLASEADFSTARIAVLAETISTYLEVMEARTQQRLAQDMVDVLSQRVSFVESRYERGLVDALPVYALRRELRDARARQPQMKAASADAEARLWMLLGGYGEKHADLLPSESQIVLSPEAIAVGVPADLITQRPDVDAARQRLQSARFALGARRAELLPSLSISGVIGLQSTDSDELFDPDQWFQNIGLNLLGPTLQGARRRANVALAEARLQEALAAFGQSVVAAVGEVESALAGLEASQERHALLATQFIDAEAESRLQAQRFASGVGRYDELLSADQLLIAARSAVSAAQRDHAHSKLALHRAVGGAWTSAR